jgi:hypothetical protein
MGAFMPRLEVSQDSFTISSQLHAQQEAGLNVLTPEARLYAIKELARRAGVSADFFRTWRVQMLDDHTKAYVLPGTDKHLRLVHAPADIWTDLARNSCDTLKLVLPWQSATPLIRDFVVPFVPKSHAHLKSLCRPIGADAVEVTVDLPLSALLMLSRWEERLIEERDDHGRISAHLSNAHQNGYLRRPIVDEYGLALQQALQFLIPNWTPTPSKFHANVSHDVDNIGLPFNFHSAVGHTVRRRRPLATARDFCSLLPRVNPTYLEVIRHLVNLSLGRGLQPAVYWKGNSRGRQKQHYDPYHPKVRAMISWLQKNNIELGVHPGYDTFRSPEKLRKDVTKIRELIGAQPMGGRQDYLRWSPESWLDWENCGLAYDSTVGYADQIGFRAGTCIPYRPWLFKLNREAHLLEVPLIVMDCTLTWYMSLNPEQIVVAVRDCIDQCRAVGGTFTLLWHNDTMIDPQFSGVLAEILDLLVGTPKYEALNPPKSLY